MTLPFVLLLGMIALAPLWFPQWWGRHYPKVALGLAAATLIYYLFFLGGGGRARVVEVAEEYFGFIALIGALFVVSGGIHVTVKGEATPHVNVVFLALGAVLANILGTTGASMLLIRPWLRMNRYRATGHHVVFFIFIVSNIGGCLTPVGDPPLFLGYLLGVPFWWVMRNCWQMWVVAVACLLIIFYIIDKRNYLRAPKAVREKLAEPPDKWRFEGLLNLVFLGVILGAVFIRHPMFLREGLMIGAAVASWFATSKELHKSNHFTFHPIQEVAILFIGIFATMMPALDWLSSNAGTLLGGNPSSALFYWGTGSLSSVLDNAPTYRSFLSAIFGAFVSPDLVAQVKQAIVDGQAGAGAWSEPVRQTMAALQRYYPSQLAGGQLRVEEIKMACVLGTPQLNLYLKAISVGAVFFGAVTYIGNAPNFMVKSIADHREIQSPSFPGFLFKWAAPILLPVLTLVWFLFFRG